MKQQQQQQQQSCTCSCYNDSFHYIALPKSAFTVYSVLSNKYSLCRQLPGDCNPLLEQRFLVLIIKLLKTFAEHDIFNEEHFCFLANTHIGSSLK